MFNSTILQNSVTNMTDMESLTYIAQNIFSQSIVLIWILTMIIAFLLMFALVRKGYGEVSAIIIITFLIQLIAFIFIIIYPIIPNMLADTFNIFS